MEQCDPGIDGARSLKNKTTRKYTEEFREQAVQMVTAVRKDHPSLWAAVNAISGQLGCSAFSLLEWVKRAGASA